jgi:hypothetical protein
MHYTWESVGDQDECTRKICYLGPYLLEHVEEEWHGEKLMMASRVWLWNDREKVPEIVVELPLVEYKRDESIKALEDWYALNILSEELFVGTIQQD